MCGSQLYPNELRARLELEGTGCFGISHSVGLLKGEDLAMAGSAVPGGQMKLGSRSAVLPLPC